MAFGIASQKPAGRGERAMMANRSEDVLDFTLVWPGIADAARGEQRQSQFARNRNGSLVARLFVAAETPLEFYVNVFSAKQVTELSNALEAAGHVSLLERMGQGSLLASREADETGGPGGDLFGFCVSQAFGRA
jgi:hypothetical protein